MADGLLVARRAPGEFGPAVVPAEVSGAESDASDAAVPVESAKATAGAVAIDKPSTKTAAAARAACWTADIVTPLFPRKGEFA